MPKYYAITGIQKGRGPNGSVPFRREVDEWWFSKEKNDLYQRSLFVYALHQFQQMDPKDRDSYFQIAGIHGQPLQSWDSKEPESDWYCVHANILFPPWHRPYMALYEQRIYEIMLKLIPTTFAAQDHAALIHAAETWRLPFWDFAEKKPDWKSPNDTSKFGPNVPYIITVPKVEVLTKTGVALVDNPMWKFTIPKTDPNKTTFGDWGITEVKSDDGTPIPFHASKSTVRYPETKDPKHPLYKSAWVDGDKQDHESITKTLRSADAVDHNTLPEAVYRLFLEKYTPDWNSFASLGYQPGQAVTQFASLEDVHGTVHDFTGGTGHMSNVGVAGFDPIFWMHHNNIDRLFALYQAVYPNKYVEPWEDKIRGKVDINTPLLPFKKDTKGTVWTPAGVRDTTNLGYTFPELQKWLPCYQTNGKFDPAKFSKAIRTTLELKYSTTGKVIATLPGNENLAKQLMQAVPVGNLKFENFPPALVELQNTLKDVGTAVSTLAGVGVGLLAGFAGAFAPPTPTPQTSVPTTSWEEHDYVLNVLYDRFALGGNPYTIRIFLGDVPFDPPAGATGAALTPFIPHADLSFANNPNQVGLVYNFSSPVEFRGTTSNGCEACKRAQEFGDLSTGQVILTDHLIGRIRDENISLSSLSKEDVSTWLKNELHWRIIDANGKLVPRETFPSLKVSVAMGKGIHYLDACKPSVYTNYETLWEITDGRPCGSSPGDHA